MNTLDINYLLQKTYSLSVTKWDFSNFYNLCNQLYIATTYELKEYRTFVPQQEQEDFFNTFDNESEILETTSPEIYKRFMNFRKGIDYIYHLEEFRQKRIGSLLDSYDLLPLIEITEKFGNELGIDIIEDMDDNSLHNLYIYI